MSIMDVIDDRVVSLSEKIGSIHGAIGITKIVCDFAAARAPYGGIEAYTDDQVQQVLTYSNCPSDIFPTLLEVGILEKRADGKTVAKLKSWRKEDLD